jgi:hypothetical protein
LRSRIRYFLCIEGRHRLVRETDTRTDVTVCCSNEVRA